MSEQNPLNFFTLKWGDKYGPEYVTRLKNSLHKYCKADFVFTCITDDPVAGINCEDITKYKLFSESVFTIEKVELMRRHDKGINVLLDLDMLIHDDITELVITRNKKPTFVYTHWTPKWHWEKLVPKKTACFMNSSFVKWTDRNAAPLYHHYMFKREHYRREYNSFDKYLFYEHYLNNNPFEFWPEGIFYNYNEQGDSQYKLLEDHKVCLFNTSHLIKLDRRYYELDNTPTEHTEIWESYD